MKIHMMMLLTIFIVNSCAAGGFYRKMFCKALENSEFKVDIHCNIVIDASTPRCSCRCFDLNSFEKTDDSLCGSDFESGNHPLEMCHGISGFYNEKWAIDIKPKIKQIEKLKADYCK